MRTMKRIFEILCEINKLYELCFISMPFYIYIYLPRPLLSAYYVCFLLIDIVGDFLEIFKVLIRIIIVY